MANVKESPKAIAKVKSETAIEALGNGIIATVKKIAIATDVFRTNTYSLMSEYTKVVFPLYVKVGKVVFESGLVGDKLEPFARSFLQCGKDNAGKYKAIFLQRALLKPLIDDGFIGGLDKMAVGANSIKRQPEKELEANMNTTVAAIQALDDGEEKQKALQFSSFAKQMNQTIGKDNANGKGGDEVRLSRTWLNKNNRDAMFVQIGLLLEATDKKGERIPESVDAEKELRQFIFDHKISKPTKRPK